MNKLSLILAAGMLCGGVAFAHDMKGMKEGGEGGKDVTVTGEIVDLACYMGHEAMGAKHGKCAKQCIKGGSPMGLKAENGEVWLLINDHESEKAFTAAKDLAGDKATVTGHTTKKGGLQGLIVEKAEKAS
jgi:hypothetical protein